MTHDIVLIGGGHTHALVLRNWGMKPVPGVRLTVINPAPSAPYTGMLPGFVAGHYTRGELEIDLVRLARFAGARLIIGRATEIDRSAKRIKISERPDIAYDIASIDIGVTSDMPHLSGFAQNGHAAKPLGIFANAWDGYLKSGQTGPLAVIGGGVAGIELALSMHHRIGRPDTEITVIEANSILSGVGAGTKHQLLNALSRRNIRCIEGFAPVDVTENAVKLSNGETIKSEFTVGAAGAKPFDWLSETGIELVDGYISVDKTLKSLNDPSIFAVGDCAHLNHAPRPKAGVFAVRAAPVLTSNLKNSISGDRLEEFNPQSHYLKLISLGSKTAVADKYNRSVSGGWAWKWKDRIDRKFMKRLNNPPFMPAMNSDQKPLCGGCGAKVGPSVLQSALEVETNQNRDDVTVLPGDDAAILKVGGAEQVITTDHLRAFWPDPYLSTRISAFHALGDIWAMGADPQALLAQIILPEMSETMQSRWLEEILTAAREVARESGANLAGGHTTLGAELTIGFTATGLISNPAKTLSGAQPNDVLVLSRPIGTGTILAAEMAGKATGSDVQNCLNLMAKNPADEARALIAVSSAMTDVTGFGLAGHAQNIALASNLTIEINSADVPHYAGALELARSGVRSSLFEANRNNVSGAFPDTDLTDLLFDPQTASGFLAAVSPDAVSSLKTSLPDHAIIGRCLPFDGFPIRIS